MEPYFAIAGDLHLDRAQYGMGIRYQDNLKCVEAILQDVLGNPQCQGLILTGDTFNRKALLPKFQILLTTIHQRLVRAGKTLLAIDGNHDGSDASWLDTVAKETNADGKTIPLLGLPAGFLSFRARPSLYERLATMQNCRAIFLHGRLLELMTWAIGQHDPDYDFSAKEIRELGIRDCTFFLGDIHTYCDFFDPVANNWFIYSGSTEMTEVSEGNVSSTRFGSCYDPVKKFLHFFPQRPHGKNWEVVNLPNRPFLKRIITPEEDPAIAIATIHEWVAKNPQGILALHFPATLRQQLAPHLKQWRSQLLSLFDIPIGGKNVKPLQDLKESDILDIAQKEMTEQQLRILRLVLTQENFEDALDALFQKEKTNATA